MRDCLCELLLGSRFFQLVLFTLLGGLVSCRATSPQEINDLYKDVIYQRDTQYRIKPGDAIQIRFFNQEGQFNQTFFVLPDGRTDPFFMNDAIVMGKTVKEFEEDVQRSYADQVKNAEISVHITPAGEVIYLRGAVTRPATMPYTLKMTLSQAISNAGGYLDSASADEVILKRSYKNPRKPDYFVVNLYDTSEEIFLLPNDQIIVDRTWWIVVRDYLNEYIWRLLPGTFNPLTYLTAGAFFI